MSLCWRTAGVGATRVWHLQIQQGQGALPRLHPSPSQAPTLKAVIVLAAAGSGRSSPVPAARGQSLATADSYKLPTAISLHATAAQHAAPAQQFATQGAGAVQDDLIPDALAEWEAEVRRDTWLRPGENMSVSR